jgi:hypothetical protein
MGKLLFWETSGSAEQNKNGADWKQQLFGNYFQFRFLLLFLCWKDPIYHRQFYDGLCPVYTQLKQIFSKDRALLNGVCFRQVLLYIIFIGQMYHAVQRLRFDQQSTEKRNQMSNWCPMCTGTEGQNSTG